MSPWKSVRNSNFSSKKFQKLFWTFELLILYMLLILLNFPWPIDSKTEFSNHWNPPKSSTGHEFPPYPPLKLISKKIRKFSTIFHENIFQWMIYDPIKRWIYVYVNRRCISLKQFLIYREKNENFKMQTKPFHHFEYF